MLDQLQWLKYSLKVKFLRSATVKHWHTCSGDTLKKLLGTQNFFSKEYFNVLHLGSSHCITIDHLFPSSVMRVYRIALHVSALRPSSEAEQVLQDLLLHSAHVQRVFTRLSFG
jgi:hypothetical protein